LFFRSSGKADAQAVRKASASSMIQFANVLAAKDARCSAAADRFAQIFSSYALKYELFTKE
jgi:hypothetical protein